MGMSDVNMLSNIKALLFATPAAAGTKGAGTMPASGAPDFAHLFDAAIPAPAAPATLTVPQPGTALAPPAAALPQPSAAVTQPSAAATPPGAAPEQPGAAPTPPAPTQPGAAFTQPAPMPAAQIATPEAALPAMAMSATATPAAAMPAPPIARTPAMPPSAPTHPSTDIAAPVIPDAPTPDALAPDDLPPAMPAHPTPAISVSAKPMATLPDDDAASPEAPSSASAPAPDTPASAPPHGDMPTALAQPAPHSVQPNALQMEQVQPSSLPPPPAATTMVEQTDAPEAAVAPPAILSAAQQPNRRLSPTPTPLPGPVEPALATLLPAAPKTAHNMADSAPETPVPARLTQTHGVPANDAALVSGHADKSLEKDDIDAISARDEASDMDNESDTVTPVTVSPYFSPAPSMSLSMQQPPEPTMIAPVVPPVAPTAAPLTPTDPATTSAIDAPRPGPNAVPAAAAPAPTQTMRNNAPDLAQPAPSSQGSASPVASSATPSTATPPVAQASILPDPAIPPTASPPADTPVRAEAVSLLQLVRDHMTGRAASRRQVEGAPPVLRDVTPLDAAPAIAAPPLADMPATPPLAAPTLQPAAIAPTAPVVDLSASLGAQVIDMGVSGQWIDTLARDIAGLSANGAQGRFHLTTDQLGAIQVDLRQGEAGLAISLTVETQAAETALRQDSDRLRLDAGLAAFRISDVKIERAPTATDPARSDTPGQQPSGHGQGQGQGQGQTLGQGSPQQQQGRWQGRENFATPHKAAADAAVINQGSSGDASGEPVRARYA